MIHSLGFKRSCAAGCYVIILLGSSVPGTKIPDFFQLTPDKLIHCLEYLTLGFFIHRWLAHDFRTVPDYARFIVGFLLATGAGAIDELYQGLIPNRTTDIYDLLLDMVGAILSIPAFNIWKKYIFEENNF